MGLIDNFKLKRDWNDVIESLDDEYAFFLTHILNMGKPRWTGELPTAAVALPLDKDGKPAIDPDEFEFLFNPEFFEALPHNARVFITAHEGMHIILNHLKLVQADHFENKQLFNIAADCVINDYLIASGMVPPTKDEMVAIFNNPNASLMLGQEQVGYNCSNRTVTEVYDDLKQQEGEGDEGDDEGEGEGEGEGGAGGGMPGDDTGGSGYFEFDSHDWIHDPEFAEKMAQAIDKAIEAAEQDAPSEVEQMREDINYQGMDMNMASPPGSGLGPEQAWAEIHGVTMAWAELLKEVDPNIFRGRGRGPAPIPSYHKARRKIQGMYPEVILPVYRKNPNDPDITDEKPVIAMFLDTSGSISDYDRKRFISLARTVPTDEIDLVAHTFTTQVKELDLENPKYLSGGTSFACIQQYIKTVLIKDERFSGKYPKAVIVVTDGEATFGGSRPTDEEAKSWYWLMTDGASTYYGDDWKKVGKNKPLREFTK